MIIDWSDYKQRQKFYHTSEWVSVRSYKMCINPLCEVCSTEERPVPATEVHHIVDIKNEPGRRLDMTNLQSICHQCHSEHTLKEAKDSWKKARTFEPLKRKWNLNFLNSK